MEKNKMTNVFAGFKFFIGADGKRVKNLPSKHGVKESDIKLLGEQVRRQAGEQR